MKKYIALALAIITLTVIICSCGNSRKTIEIETDENGEIITTTTTTKQTTSKNPDKEITSTENSTETTKKNDEFEFPEDHYIKTGYKKTAMLGPAFIETPSRVIFSRGFNGRLCYYSKVDEGFFIFCFDPLCDHKTKNCFSSKFSFGYMTQPVYAEYNNRLYLPFKDCLYSSKFDGTDIRLEVALGEYGKELGKRTNDGEEIICIQTYDNYVYFSFPVAKYNKQNDLFTEYYYQLYRYNLDTQKLENLFEKTEYSSKTFRAFYLSHDKLFFYDVTKEGPQLFSANVDMTNCHSLDVDAKYASLFSYDGVIFDGKMFYSIANYKIDDDHSVQSLVKFDPENEEISTIYDSEIGIINENGVQFFNGQFKLNAVTDEYIYFTVEESPLLIGKYRTKNGYNYIYNYSHKTYRINKDGCGKTLVFEGVTNNDPKAPSFSLEEFYFSDSKVIAQIYAYTYSTPTAMPNGYESVNWMKTQFVTFDIAPDGSFVNMHELVLDE